MEYLKKTRPLAGFVLVFKVLPTTTHKLLAGVRQLLFVNNLFLVSFFKLV